MTLAPSADSAPALRRRGQTQVAHVATDPRRHRLQRGGGGPTAGRRLHQPPPVFMSLHSHGPRGLHAARMQAKAGWVVILSMT